MILASLLLVGAAEITLLDRAEVHGTEVALGQIATISCDDPTLRQRMLEHSFGYAPAPGYSRLLRKEEIERGLRGAFAGEQLRILGAAATRVVPLTETLRAGSVEQAVREALARELAGSDAELSLAAAILDRELPKGAAPARLDVDLSARKPQAGANAVPVRVFVDGELYTTVWTNWRIDVWREEPVLARNIEAGSEVSLADVSWQRMLQRPGSPQAVLTRETLTDAVALRGLVAGDVLRTSDVRRRQLVQQGDTVMLEVRNGNVQARVSATAREGGQRGDRIRILVANSDRELRAVVVERDLVRLEMGGNLELARETTTRR